jgi:hypothetical protein
MACMHEQAQSSCSSEPVVIEKTKLKWNPIKAQLSLFSALSYDKKIDKNKLDRNLKTDFLVFQLKFLQKLFGACLFLLGL